jgi:mRNA export factor
VRSDHLDAPLLTSTPQAPKMALFGTATSASTSAGNTTGDISKDVALNQPPDDSISDLSFSPTSDFLAVASWDKRLRIYEVSEQGQSQGKAEITFDGPVLNCSWSHVRYQTPELCLITC